MKKARKRKSDWRKKIDLGVGDETEALEDMHAVERLKKMEDSELFAYDRERPSKRQKGRSGGPLMPSRDPSIPVLQGRHHHKAASALVSGTAGAGAGIGKKKRVSSVMETRHVARMAQGQGQGAGKGKGRKEKKETGAYDMWDTEAVDSAATAAPIPNPKARKRVRPKPKYAEVVPASAPPAPGASYRPSYAAHQALLAQEVEREEEVLRNRAREAAVTIVGNDDDAVIHDRIGAADSDASDSGSENEEENENENGDGSKSKSKSKSAVPERLTEKQKRRRAAHKAAVRDARMRKMERANVAILTDAPRLARDLHRQQAEADVRHKARREKKEVTLPRLGKLPYKQPAEAVLLSEELPVGLRDLEPQGSGLRDRFDSLMRRGIIEPRRRTTQKKKFGKKAGGMQKAMQRAFIDL